MTFIFSNITNWLSDSQSSESSVGADAINSVRSDDWIATNEQSYDKVRRSECDMMVGSHDSTAEDADEDFPGISKVVSSAIEWGGYFLNVGKETGKSVTRTAFRHIKSALEENASPEKSATEKPIADKAVAPWVGYDEESVVKKQILSISQDKNNFLRGPPVGVQYRFDYAVSYPVAMVMLDEDPSLKTMRFELVPKQVKEETFWRNYFYHVALIEQSAQLMFQAKHRAHGGDHADHKIPTSDTDLVFVADTFKADDDDNVTAAGYGELNEDLKDYEMVELADCDGAQAAAT